MADLEISVYGRVGGVLIKTNTKKNKTSITLHMLSNSATGQMIKYKIYKTQNWRRNYVLWIWAGLKKITKIDIEHQINIISSNWRHLLFTWRVQKFQRFIHFQLRIIARINCIAILFKWIDNWQQLNLC